MDFSQTKCHKEGGKASEFKVTLMPVGFAWTQTKKPKPKQR